MTSFDQLSSASVSERRGWKGLLLGVLKKLAVLALQWLMNSPQLQEQPNERSSSGGGEAFPRR